MFKNGHCFLLLMELRRFMCSAMLRFKGASQVYVLGNASLLTAIFTLASISLNICALCDFLQNTPIWQNKV